MMEEVSDYDEKNANILACKYSMPTTIFLFV